MTPHFFWLPLFLANIKIYASHFHNNRLFFQFLCALMKSQKTYEIHCLEIIQSTWNTSRRQNKGFGSLRVGSKCLLWPSMMVFFFGGGKTKVFPILYQWYCCSQFVWIGRMQGSWNIFILLPKNLSWKVMGKSQRAKSETPWLRRNRVSEPWNWSTKSHGFDREFPCPESRTLPARLWRWGHTIPLSFQRDLVGQFPSLDARFLLNQGISDFTLWDFPITFQDKFFGNKMKKIHDPCIRPIGFHHGMKNVNFWSGKSAKNNLSDDFVKFTKNCHANRGKNCLSKTKRIFEMFEYFQIGIELLFNLI